MLRLPQGKAILAGINLQLLINSQNQEIKCQMKHKNKFTHKDNNAEYSAFLFQPKKEICLLNPSFKLVVISHVATT